jgi:hypothetical protein
MLDPSGRKSSPNSGLDYQSRPIPRSPDRHESHLLGDLSNTSFPCFYLWQPCATLVPSHIRTTQDIKIWNRIAAVLPHRRLPKTYWPGLKDINQSRKWKFGKRRSNAGFALRMICLRTACLIVGRVAMRDRVRPRPVSSLAISDSHWALFSS